MAVRTEVKTEVTPEVTPDSTTARTRAGRPIHVDPLDARGQRLVEANGDLNPSSTVLWHRALGLYDWDVVVDVGVNYGEMLVGAPIPARSRVVGFEPNTSLHPFLERTCADNVIDLDLRAEAVSEHVGTAPFAVDGAWSGTSTLVLPTGEVSPRWETREVSVTTLDAVLGDTPAWCAKIDAEQAEMPIVRGASAAMSRSRHWAMLLEVLHLPVEDLARIAAQHPTYLLDKRTGALVRVPGGNVRLARVLLGSGWLYPQDCLVVSAAVRDLVES